MWRSKSWNIKKILNTPQDSETGYFVECDLENVNDEKTNKFPLTPMKSKIEYEELLSYQQQRKVNKNPSIDKINLWSKW